MANQYGIGATPVNIQVGNITGVTWSSTVSWTASSSHTAPRKPRVIHYPETIVPVLEDIIRDFGTMWVFSVYDDSVQVDWEDNSQPHRFPGRAFNVDSVLRDQLLALPQIQEYNGYHIIRLDYAYEFLKANTRENKLRALVD